MFKLVPVEEETSETIPASTPVQQVNTEDLIKSLPPRLQKRGRKFIHMLGQPLPFKVLPDHKLEIDGVITAGTLEDFITFVLSPTTYIRPLALNEFLRVIHPHREKIAPLFAANKRKLLGKR